MAREARTIELMIGLWCRARHGGTAPCDQCQELVAYARERLRRCPFQEGKTTCGQCSVHCYRPASRESIRAVMRFAGPRMLWRHPLLALHHFADSRRREPLQRGARKGRP
ncbi:MAG: nitrous oxide-stimulated promoter family protein [Deltaproteobacteria bacterium]|nr:nitrous oxide-stimulated promoter family protein [Deltaproteobacteria bacterium]